MCCNPNSYEDTTPLLGVVLSGGESSRMGMDKGLLMVNDQTWVQHCYEKLTRFSIPVSVSINPSQVKAYQETIHFDDLIPDKFPVKGPLGGILSVHDKFPDNDLLVIACDLPDVSISILKELVSQYDDRSGEHDFFVYQYEGEFEPLVGIYTSEGLRKITALYLSNQLEKFSMKYVLQEGNTYSIDIDQESWKQFKNYNRQEDLG